MISASAGHRYHMSTSTYEHLINWALSGFAPCREGEEFELCQVIREWLEGLDQEEAVNLLERSNWSGIHYLATRVL